MANGSPYVTWRYMNEHEEQSKKRDKLIQSLTAEVMGDKESGRPSLRKGFEGTVGEMMEKMTSEHRKTRITIISGVSIAVIAWIVNLILTNGSIVQGAVK